MRRLLIASICGLTLSSAAIAGPISSAEAVKAYAQGKADGPAQSAYQIASCAGYWGAWTKYALENYKDPFIASLPDSMKSSDALKNQLYWQEKAVAEVKAGRIQGAVAQSMLETSRSLVTTSVAEGTATAMTRVFKELGRCHVQR